MNCQALPDRAEEIRALRDHDAAEGIRRAEVLLESLEQSEVACPSGRMLVEAALASNLHIAGRYDQALEAVGQAIKLAEEVDEPVHCATVYRTAGVVFWEVDAHHQALTYYQQALDLSRKAGDDSGIARTAGNIGNLHTALGNLDEAERYHLQALEAFESLSWGEGVAGTLVNLGALAARRAEALERADETQAAQQHHRDNLDYNRRALAIFEKLDNPRGIAYAADNVARALTSLGQAEAALAPARRSQELRQKVGDSMGVVRSLLTRADALAALGEIEDAIGLLAEARAMVGPDNRSIQREVLQRQADLLAREQNFEKALGRLRELVEIERAMAAEQTAARVEELELKYRAEQLEQQLALERAGAELSEQRVHRQRIISLGATLTALLLLLIAVLAYNRYRLGKKVSRSLDRAARTDPVTGLSNRRDMTERIQRAIIRSEEDHEKAALVMADIDSFKRINDTLGHQGGDQVLIHVAQLMREHVRGQDVVSRWGGEEFMMLLPNTDLEGAVSVSENLRRALAETPPVIAGQQLVLTMTFGVAETYPGIDFNTLIKRADDAMYVGKARGKDRVVASEESGV